MDNLCNKTSAVGIAYWCSGIYDRECSQPNQVEMNWSGGLVDWVEGDTAYVSVAFSWRANDAYSRCSWLQAQGYKVRVGGPGIVDRNIRLQFEGVAEIGGQIDAVVRHNPAATFASRGCPVGCYFCIVPKLEGTKFALIPDFTPRPILCDNNVSALPEDYQDYIIERYKQFNVKLIDINSGFEPHTFTESTYRRWQPFYHGGWRFAYDEMKEREQVINMVDILKDEPAYKKRVYVLIGNEPYADCMERVQSVIDWGCEPHVQPMIALGALTKKPVVQFDWTERKLKDVTRWANKWIWRTVKFQDYSNTFKGAKYCTAS
jgi:hypothetical protein